ncbi:TPA: DUF6119 family protein [Mannheimia haemolytica]
MARTKTNRINIFKLRSHFTIDNFSSINEYEKIFSDEKSSLFIQKNKRSTPEWSKFIAPLAPEISFENYSNSFIYLINYKNNLYALTGGYGFKIIQEYIEDEFGLDVALRLIDNLSISAIHQFSIKSQTRQIQRSVANYNPNFDNENYNKILKSISGKGEFSGKHFVVQGKSSIILRTEKDIRKIEQVLDEINKILGQEEKIKIPKSYKQVKNKELIHKLNLNCYRKLYKFYKNINSGESTLYLDLPDPFKRFDYSEYELSIKNNNFKIDELDIDEIKVLIQENFQMNLSLKELLNIHIMGITTEGEKDFYHNNSLERLIVCETSLNNQHYVKLDGKWFNILDNIISFIDDKIRNITIENDYLPKWNADDIKNKIISIEKNEGRKNYAEQIYNDEVSKQKGFLLLDRNLIKTDEKSKIELADLYDHSKHRFIHIKNVWGAKSSYLFSQAYIASTLYANSKEFREKCTSVFTISEETKKTVVIAIAIESKKISGFPLNMSSFSKISLFNTINNIRNDGYDVILTPIEII